MGSLPRWILILLRRDFFEGVLDVLDEGYISSLNNKSVFIDEGLSGIIIIESIIFLYERRFGI